MNSCEQKKEILIHGQPRLVKIVEFRCVLFYTCMHMYASCIYTKQSVGFEGRDMGVGEEVTRLPGDPSPVRHPVVPLRVRELPPVSKRDFFSDNLLVRIRLIIEMIWWTGFAPWEFALIWATPHLHQLTVSVNVNLRCKCAAPSDSLHIEGIESGDTLTSRWGPARRFRRSVGGRTPLESRLLACTCSSLH